MTDGLFQNTRIAKGGTPLPHPLPRVRKHERIHHHINTYDDWHRLKTATGEFNSFDGSKTANYHLEMGYDNLYNITTKKLTMSQTNLQFAGTLSAGHEFNYNYSNDNPMQLASVETKQYNVDGEIENVDEALAKNLHTQNYEFDDNGNMVSVSVASLKPETQEPETTEASEEKDVLKSFLWDEENRLLAVNNNGSVSCYFYDAAGERTVKLTSESEMVHVNGKKVGGNDNICKFTAYVSPYFVVSNGGAYTKHIYAASQRIASKLGNEDGFGADPRRVEQAGGLKKTDNLATTIKARYESLGIDYEEAKKEEVLPDSTMDSEEPENLVFFYHPDHLGSTSYVTDADGNIAQHVEYIPYGEVFVEERNNSFSTNYLFNAKELDNETGLYYYGARYLDPTGAMWLSVDPVFHAGTSPYAYCLGNPVKMVDPDGRDEIYCREDGSEISRIEKEEEVRYVLGTNQPTFQMYSEYSPSEKGYSDMMGVGDAMIGEMLIKDICEGNGNPLIPKEYIRDRYFVRAPNQDEFDASMNFIGDDGTGGRADNNNREYSFDLQPFDIKIGSRYVPNGYVAYNTFIGPVGDPSKDETASTESRINHTHPSGVGSKSEKDKWQQAPSATDIENSNSMIRRVWGMGSKTIYLFNKDGVKATIPFSVYGR